MDFNELWSVARQAAIEISGADHCYVAQVRLADRTPRRSYGEYVPWEDNGTIHLDQTEVGAYLGDLLRGRVEGGNLDRTIDAIATVNHEHIHALGPSDRGVNFGVGRILDAARQRPINRGPRNIEEAVTESWNELTLAQFINATKLHDLEPQLVGSLEFANAYPWNCEVLHPVTECFAQLLDTDSVDVLRAMACETADTRSARLAQWVASERGWADVEGSAQAENDLAVLFDSFLDYRLVVQGANHGHEVASAITNLVKSFES